MRNLKSGFILSYISIFIQSIISILYTPVMLRLLGESNYGLLQLAISTMSSLSILSFGFGSSYMRFYSQYKADNDNNAISVLNGMFTIIFISVSILSLIVGGFITMNTSTLFGKSMTASEIKLLKTLLGIMTVNLAFTFPCSISDSYIIAQERFSFQKILIIISSLLNPMLTFPLLIMGHGAVSVAICMTAITVIKLLCGTVYCIKKLNMRFCFAFDKNVFKQLSVFSFFVFLNIISDQINWNVDKILLGMSRCKKCSRLFSRFSIQRIFSYIFLCTFVTYDAKGTYAYRKPCRQQRNKQIFCVIRQSAVCRYGLYLFYNNRSRQTFYQTLVGD